MVVLISGVVLGVMAYATAYFLPTAGQRAMLRGAQPELAWLKQEFRLSENEFTRIAALHNAYRPQCAEMCRQIQACKDELREELARTNAMTPEIERLLVEVSRLRLKCHTNMLAHFLEVSRAMPEPQGRRYLEWVQAQTILREEDMARHHAHH